MDDGPPGFPQGFSCPVVLGNGVQRAIGSFAYGAITLFGGLFQTPSARSMLCNSPTGLQPDPTPPLNTEQATLAGLTPLRFGLFRFRSPLLAESRLLSLPGGTEMVHFPPFASTWLCIHPGMAGHDPCRVTPFGNPRVKARLQLPEAYRSLPRPSSPLCAKASTVHP